MLFTVTCDQFNLGTHFLIWSVHYLSGNDKYYHFVEDEKMEIPKDPLMEGTAHVFSANESIDLDDILLKFDLHLRSSDNLNHIKYHPLVKSIKEYHDCNKKFQKSMTAHRVKTINITCSGLQHLIGFLRFDTAKSKWQEDIETVKKHCGHYWPDFFNDREIYEDNLETFHDIREGIAFRLRPYEFWEHFDSRSSMENMMTYDFYHFITKGEKIIRDVMDFLGLSVNDDRIKHWNDVHKRWGVELVHYLHFCNDIEHIVENIVSNRYMSLSQYKMNVLKEAVLLHFLMFKHDLNLSSRTDQLPNNTQEISKLLVKNTRTGIKKLYKVQKDV